MGDAPTVTERSTHSDPAPELAYTKERSSCDNRDYRRERARASRRMGRPGPRGLAPPIKSRACFEEHRSMKPN